MATLFDDHAGMVLGLCRLLLRDHHEAEDAAQQTFVSAYRSLLRGNEPRDDASWLAAIARNECRARIRKRMRSPIAIDGELIAQIPDPSDIVETADRRRELGEITVALADLPIRQREAIALRDFLGLSYEEVASTLSVSVPVVESLLFRARRRLRDTVRTVPRYAAGIAALPLAMRGVLARDAQDLDTVGSIASLVGGAAAAVGASAAKLLSLPFAAKAATAVAVVAAGTAVAPLLNDPGLTTPPSAAAPAALDYGRDVQPSALLALTPPSAESAQASEAPQGVAEGESSEAAGESTPDPAPADENGDMAASPDRLSAAAPGTGDPPILPQPATPEDAAAAACEQAADEGAPAKGWGDAESTGETGGCAAGSTAPAADSEAPSSESGDAAAPAPDGLDATDPVAETDAEPASDPGQAPADESSATPPGDTP